jgi:hypothetical protein
MIKIMDKVLGLTIVLMAAYTLFMDKVLGLTIVLMAAYTLWAVMTPNHLFIG